jgi:CubicO group peptidase (beta-lactamase class C family)
MKTISIITLFLLTILDSGGGGLVSTTKDMGLLKFGANYGMGIYKYELNSKIFYGHGGFYGSILAYDPVEKITFSANIGQANPPYDAGKLVNELMNIIMTK